MRTHGKKYRKVAEGRDLNAVVAPKAALEQVKGAAFAKFDETVDVAIRLGVDPRHADQIVFQFSLGAEPLPYETASRISYAIWNSMPDAELFRAAAAGELGTAAGVEKQVRRMLKDPRARSTVDEFVSEWMRFDRLLGAVKERASFPMYTPELANAMTEEARRLVEHLVWNNANFMELYSADYAFFDAARDN